jgi:hypothetical protein
MNTYQAGIFKYRKGTNNGIKKHIPIEHSFRQGQVLTLSLEFPVQMGGFEL